MRVCNEELKDQKKVPNGLSKLGDIQLLGWDHKEEMIEGLQKAVFFLNLDWGHYWSAGSADGKERWKCGAEK